eukprot:scaffold125074_cov18-Tisochrysis_lutea.AAC.3
MSWVYLDVVCQETGSSIQFYCVPIGTCQFEIQCACLAEERIAKAKEAQDKMKDLLNRLEECKKANKAVSGRCVPGANAEANCI